MAVNIGKATTLSNRDAFPQVINDPRTWGPSFQTRGRFTTVTSDSIASQYGICSVFSGWVITSCELSCAALSTSVAGNIGLYETPAINGAFSATSGWLTTAGSVSGAGSYFGAAVAMSSAVTKQQQLLGNSSFTTLLNWDQKVWQILGLTSDPQRFYDVVITMTVAVVAGGTVALDISYKPQY